MRSRCTDSGCPHEGRCRGESLGWSCRRPLGTVLMAAPWSQHTRGINVAMALLVEQWCNSRAVWWGQAWWTNAFPWCLIGLPHRWARVDELAHPLSSPQLRRRSISLEAAWRPAPSNSTRSTHRASALRRHMAGGVSGSPRAVGWRQGAAPGASFSSGGIDALGALQASGPPAVPPPHRPREGELERPLAA